MINAHKFKYHFLYWEIAYAAARQSLATRAKVGAVIVSPTGMISIGWNGMPAGFDNEPEYNSQLGGDSGNLRQTKLTKPEVIHAERNAIDKMTRQGISTEGSIMFSTLAPCMHCAKSIHGLGFETFYYREAGKTVGIEFLEQAGVSVIHSPF